MLNKVSAGAGKERTDQDSSFPFHMNSLKRFLLLKFLGAKTSFVGLHSPHFF